MTGSPMGERRDEVAKNMAVLPPTSNNEIRKGSITPCLVLVEMSRTRSLGQR